MSDTPDTQTAARDGFADWLPLKANRVAPGEYEILAADGMRLWYMEGAALAEWICERVNESASLRSAIVKHRSQKADDRCVEDDDELYAALGDGMKCDRRIGDKVAMLANCARFIERRCEGGGWPTYAELEAVVEAAKAWRKRRTVMCDCGVPGCVADKALAAAVDSLLKEEG